MSRVTQQINLYQPVAQINAGPFSFNTALRLVACVAAGLLSVWGYGVWRVQRLEHAVSQLREQQDRQTQTLAALAAARAEGVSPEQLDNRVQQLTAQLAAHSSALALVRNGDIGTTAGFSGRLSALARHPVEGLWITHVDFASVGAAKLNVAGVALQPSLVPRYLEALATEPALVGMRFDDFTIERPSHDPAATPDASPHDPVAAPEHGFVFKAGSGAAGAGAGDHRS